MRTYLALIMLMWIPIAKASSDFQIQMKLQLKQEGFNQTQIETIARKIPRNLSQERIQAVCKWLRDQGVSEVTKVVTAAPTILTLSIPHHLEQTVTLLKSFGVTQLGKVITKAPHLLICSTSGNLVYKIEWLQKQGVTDIGKFITSAPSVLGLSLSMLELKTEWLRDQGVTDIGRVLSMMPLFLTYSIEKRLNPVVHWLKEQGVTDVGKAIRSNPSILGRSIPTSLEPKIKWFKDQGLSDTKKIINKFPNIFALSTETSLPEKISWLRHQGFRDVGTLIAAYPSIISFSIQDNLEPSLHELVTFWGISIEDIERTPMILGMSLRRLQDLRTVINSLSHLANQGDFQFSKIDLRLRTSMITRLTPEEIVKRLVQLEAIGSLVSTEDLRQHRFDNYGLTEKHRLEKLFQSGQFFTVLKRYFSIPSKDSNQSAKFCIPVL